MSDVQFARRMARYNHWQNTNLLTATATLVPPERRRDRDAFFGSIEATFAHILWADQLWMSRFAPDDFAAPPGAPGKNATIEWGDFLRDRAEMDQRLITWTNGLQDADFEVPITWFSGLRNATLTRPRAFILTHVFNHQTHHRGQIHAMLTAAGAVPGDTDLMFMDPDDTP